MAKFKIEDIKLGEIVYRFNPLRTRIDEWVVHNITIGRFGYFRYVLYKKDGLYVEKSLRDIGDNVFLTREEAEQLL